MADETGTPVLGPPSTTWLIVAIASLFVVGRGAPTQVSPVMAEPSTAVERTAPAPTPPDDPVSLGDDQWVNDVWGAADLFRRFLGEAPRRERNAPDDPRSVLELHAVPQLDELEEYQKSKTNDRHSLARDELGKLRTRVEARATVSTLIATIPDYPDSNGRWRADEILSAIQAAAGQASFALFDFYLPDWRAEAAAKRPQTQLDHEREPAALLFRGETANELTLLLVLLVPETSTAGVHGAVLKTAVRFARDWGANPVRIVGPNSSGSTVSVRLALEDVACSGDLNVQIVSGMATSSSNKEGLDRPGGRFVNETRRCPQPNSASTPGNLTVNYRTTVHYDEDFFRVLHEQLVRIEPKWADGEGVALLVDNTSWGAGVLSERSDAPCSAPQGVMHLPCARRLRFPLHVSRLVGPAEDERKGSSGPAVPAWMSPLLPRAPAVGDTITPSDALPAFTPNTTSTVVSAMLHDTLETLARGEFGAVGILATDIRDHLFLAREISRVAPGVLMFGTEPHVLMLHPDYQPYVRGTLMASSYPGHAHAQRLTSAAGGMQFASMGAQGTYNAVLSMLTSRPAGQERLPDLIDYSPPRLPGSPENVESGPVPWVVLVGRDTFLPLVAGKTQNTPKGVLVPSDSAVLPDRSTYLLASWPGDFLWAAPAVLLMAHLVILGIAQIRPIPYLHVFSPPKHSPGRQTSEHRLLTLACALALAMGLAWQLRLWETLSRVSAHESAAPPLIRVIFAATLVVSAGAALLMGLVAAGRAVEAWRAGAAHAELTSLASTGLALWMAWAFVRYLTDGELWTGTTAVFHVERTLGLASFTSPLPAIAAMLGLGYGWAFWGLRSLHHHVVDTKRAEPVFALFGGKGSGLSRELMLGARSTIHPLGRFMLLPAFVVPAIMLLGVPRTYSVEGAHFGWVISLGSVLGIVAVSVELGQAAWLGKRIKRALGDLHRHALGPTIEDLANEPADWGMSLEPGRGSTSGLLAERLNDLGERLGAFHSELLNHVHRPPAMAHPDRRRSTATSVPDPWEEALGDRIKIRSSDVHELSGNLKNVAPVNERPIALLRTPTWARALDVASVLVPLMENRYWRSRRPVPTYTVAGRFLKDAERFVALVTAVVMRTLVVRVVRGLSIAAVIGGTLLLGHLFYTFPGRRFWLLVDFIALTVVAVVAVRQLLILERDHLLSKLWSSTPGQIGISSGLLWRATAAASLPLLTLLAVMFPEVGGNYLAWIEPLKQLMPVP